MKKLDFEELKHNPEIKPLQVLDEDGKVVNPDLMPDLSDEELVELFKQMVWSRVLGDRTMSFVGKAGWDSLPQPPVRKPVKWVPVSQ